MIDDDPILARVVQDGSPATDDIAAKLVRSRVAAALFGTVEPMRVGRYELERQLGAGGGGIVFVAKDPELSRRVALKLLGTHGRREQMLAEAHALARLAHPNVVPIFDVGTHEDQIYLVMELVEGGTLRTWLEDAPRTIRAIVRTYREAGAGLAAAHRAGFVHRDFKPDNALVGADHRARVVDFGLVHVEGEARAGLGTPRYMPPEQAAGGEITPAADQYAFCASLREAVRARKDEHDQRAGDIPRWLDVILARGLSREPAARYPSMDSLVDALALDPAARWRRRGIVAGVLALGASAFIIGRAQSDSLPTCDGGRTELAAVWNPAVRDAIATKLDALGTPYSKEVKPKLVGALGDYAKLWSAGHLDACKDHRRGAQSDALFDRRMRCLDAARAALGAAVAVVRETTPDDLAQAVIATGELPALPRCADTELLSTNIKPPPPAHAAAIAEIERELAAREVEIRAGHTKIVPELDALIARARAFGYPHLLAKALRLRGVCAILSEKREEAVAPLFEATQLAFTAGDDELGVEAFARRAWAEGTTKDKNDAFGGVPFIEAISSRLPVTSRGTRALLASSIGSLEMSRGNRAAARVAFARAHAEQADATGPMASELAQIAYNYAITLDDARQRDGLFALTIAKLTALVGRSHPTTLKTRCAVAARLDDAAAAETALATAVAELREFHPDRRWLIASYAFNLAWLGLQRGDADVARNGFQVVLDAAKEVATEDAANAVRVARAHLLRLDGQASDAAKAFAEHHATLKDVQEPWWRQIDLVEAELGLALSQTDAGDRAAARATFERVRPRILFVMEKQPSATRRRYLQFVDRKLTNRTGSP